MALVDESGKVLGNLSPLFKSFATETEFNDFKAKMSVEEFDNVFAIKNYMNPSVPDPFSTCLVGGQKYGIRIQRKVNFFTITSDTPITVKVNYTGNASWASVSYRLKGERPFTQIPRGQVTRSGKIIEFTGYMFGDQLFTDFDYNNRWVITGGTNVRLSGDITTLINAVGGLNAVGDYCFSNMFTDQDSITEANITLPKIMGRFAARQMFRGCHGLRIPPKIDTIDMGTSCFMECFQYARALIEMPDLPAKVLTKECYQEMFLSCEKIQKVKPLNFGTCWCARGMFMDVPDLFSPVQTDIYTVPVSSTTEQIGFSNLGHFQGTIYGKG